MMLYIFDENDEYFMNPCVPTQVPAQIKLVLKVLCGKALSVRAHLHQDGIAGTETFLTYSGIHGSYEIYTCNLNIERAGLYWLSFRIYTIHGSIVTVPEDEGSSFQITVFDKNHETPNWIYGGLIYHIFVDRFHKVGEPKLATGAIYREDWGGIPHFLPDELGIVKNNDFFGGNLQGVVEKLPYLEELGVTCIYLSPIFEAASNHKYDTGDYMKIDPAFGTNETLERLCTEAKARNMRVILDGVFNHVGADSRYFNKYDTYDSLGAYQSADSPYRSWFNFNYDGTYDSWWGIDILPSINEGNESYIDFICGENGVIEYWNSKGVSGWRLDVVDELPDVFLDPLCKAMRKSNDESYIVGEVWEDASNKIAYSVRRRYFLGGQLHSVTNYPLKVAIISCVKEGNVAQLAHAMAMLCRNYPSHILNGLMNVLGTHDTMRILTVLGGENLSHDRPGMSKYRLSESEMQNGKKLLKLAATLQFTLPGVPCVFYGDEAGVEGGADPFCRACYPWGKEDHALLSWYTKLSQVRKSHGSFKEGKYTLVEAREGLFAFVRGEGAQSVLVAVNVSDSDRVISAEGYNFNVLANEYTNSLEIKAWQPGIYSIKV